MDNENPAHAGWRLARENPKLVLLEVAWRWSFGILALLLLGWAVASVLHRVTISDADWVALRSLDLHDTPYTLAKIIILFWQDLLLVLATLLSALALAWMITATWGRAATLRILEGRSNTPAVAGLNLLRFAARRVLGVKEFEFSQNYLMFWDKLERANYFFEAILESGDRDVGDRSVAFLLDQPLSDGGQWNMFINLVQKHGLVPKSAMPEESSRTAVQSVFIPCGGLKAVCRHSAARSTIVSASRISRASSMAPSIRDLSSSLETSISPANSKLPPTRRNSRISLVSRCCF